MEVNGQFIFIVCSIFSEIVIMYVWKKWREIETERERERESPYFSFIRCTLI